MKQTKKKKEPGIFKISIKVIHFQPGKTNKQTKQASKQASRENKQIINIRNVEVINANVINYIKWINKEKKEQVYDHKTDRQMKYITSLKEIDYHNSYKEMIT